MTGLPVLPADEYRADAFSRNTRRAYRADLNDFLAWLRERGVDKRSGKDTTTSTSCSSTAPRSAAIVPSFSA